MAEPLAMNAAEAPSQLPSSALPTVQDGSALRLQIARWRAEGRTIAFVPTMGSLHDGHLSLVRHGLQVADRVVASVFVNPSQFSEGEDFATYPRDPERDAALLESEGCHLLFLPEVQTVYPPGHSTWVRVEGPSHGFEGEQRQGHFEGVATVVAQLLLLVQPDFAIFGQKDAQQLAVVRRLVRDLHLPVQILGAPIVREADGLAMSSRNVYLSSEERLAAASLSRALRSVERLILGGERDAKAVTSHIRAILEEAPGAQIDYIAPVDADSFEPVETVGVNTVIPIAVRFGKTRLLDNLLLETLSEPQTAQTAVPRKTETQTAGRPS